MTDLEGQLAELEARWFAAALPQSGVLAPGLDRETARARLRWSTGHEPPEDVVTWYAWHDGASILPAPVLAPSRFDLLRRHHAIFQYHPLVKQAQELATECRRPVSDFWEDSWWPIGDDAGGGHLAVDLKSPDGVLTGPDRTGPVRSVDWSDEAEGTRPRTRSLRDLLDVWLSALDLGRWFWNHEGAHWDADHDAVPRELGATDPVE